MPFRTYNWFYDRPILTITSCKRKHKVIDSTVLYRRSLIILKYHFQCLLQDSIELSIKLTFTITSCLFFQNFLEGVFWIELFLVCH